LWKPLPFRVSGNGFIVEVGEDVHMHLNDFKIINDTHGHAAGDEVLCKVNERIKDQIREEDMLARFSGDEFGLLLRRSGRENQDLLANRILDVISQPIILSTGVEVLTSISIGMSTYKRSLNTVNYHGLKAGAWKEVSSS
jgi:diguanylate cyclase (GGDEF)-like protein